jgi:hypothetical protein
MALELDTATLQAALVGYQQQLEQIEAKMGELRRRLGKSAGVKPAAAATTRSAPRKHRMSAEGRARIAAAQRARWAKTKKAKKATAGDQ